MIQRINAIIWLTWKAALRFRLFLVVTVLLLSIVVILPLILKDDGTARGFTQILLTYTLGTISALLGLTTLWLSCGTLARDIDECQVQVVAVKPIARWEIWLGKWLGILSLNAALLAISGGCVYGLLQWRATRLPPEQQAVLRKEVLVARGGVREKSVDAEIEAETQRRFQERMEKDPPSRVDLPEVRRQIRELVKAEYQVVPPGFARQWEIDLSAVKDAIKDRPLQVRIKFNCSDLSTMGTYPGVWMVGSPQTGKVWTSEVMSMAPETFHEFEVPPNLVDERGTLTIAYNNLNQIGILFPIEDGLEVLYREGSFELNYLRGLAVIFCWMALLATIGLTTSSFLSFPVAAFVSLGVLFMVLTSGTMANAVSEGTVGFYDPEAGRGHSPLDVVVIPMFRGALKVISLAKDFSPIDSLSTGRSIGWGQLGLAFAQIVLLLGGILAAVGISVFTRRELATAQGNQ
jgi:hypothetical protein